ncbi:MAG: RagB/SusD family nutrient uptake outer membrane protein [Longimicrobiales bacterium]
MKNIGCRVSLISALLTAGLAVSGCTETIIEPKSTVTGANVFDDPSAYRAFLAKLYAGLAVSGQQGPAGEPDIEGIDEGFSQYIRGYWQLQELPTAEAVIGWGDVGLPEIVTSQWASSNQFVTAMYYRIFYQIALVNEFLRETTDQKLTERGVDDALRTEIQQFRAEARFLRALSYWHGIDLFADIPLVTEEFAIGATPPEQSTREEIFAFIEAELLAIRSELPAVGMAEYGRADQGALSMLLAKLYLNAEAYGLGARYADALAEAEIVIAGPYSLDPNYQDMFLADNHTSPELIFAVPFDGQFTQTWGGTTFLTHAAVGGTMDAEDYGLDGGWFGLRVTQQAVALYEGGANGPDERSDIFYTDNQDLVVGSLGRFEDGFAFPKYRNVTSTGVPGSHSTFPDTDFPMFRLADAYLIYAEAHLRGGGGTAAQALAYVNAIRQRAYGDGSGDITAAELTLDFILDERGRELIWEAHRRTDLVRFGVFTGAEQLWAFKGGVPEGQATAEFLDLYPIPANEILSNPNLTQNPGY